MASRTGVLTIRNYSKLVPSSTSLMHFHFGDLVMLPAASAFVFAISTINTLETYSSGIKLVSLEILDRGREHAVFHKDLGTWLDDFLMVHRRELEASSCLLDDSFTIWCTPLPIPSPKRDNHISWSRCCHLLRRSFFIISDKNKDKEKPKPGTRTILESHTFTIHDFSELNAELRTGKCARYSNSFTLSGMLWTFWLDPSKLGEDYVTVLLTRYTGLARDEQPQTVEFNFELLHAGDDGHKLYESVKVTRTFSLAHAQHKAHLLVPRHQHLNFRCCLAALTVVDTAAATASSWSHSALSATRIQNQSDSDSESELTPPLLSDFDSESELTPPLLGDFDSESELTPLLSSMHMHGA